VEFKASDTERNKEYGILGAVVGLGVGAALKSGPLGMFASAAIGAAAGMAISTIQIRISDGNDGDVTLTTV